MCFSLMWLMLRRREEFLTSFCFRYKDREVSSCYHNVYQKEDMPISYQNINLKLKFEEQIKRPEGKREIAKILMMRGRSSFLTSLFYSHSLPSDAHACFKIYSR
jgi:hypothetical protein